MRASTILAAAALAAGLASLSFVGTAIAGLLDDFNDGVDPRWIILDTNLNPDGTGIPKPWGPGLYSALNGQLHIGTTGPVPPNPALPQGDPAVFDTLNSGAVALIWGPSAVDPTFSSGHLRAKARAGNASNVPLVLRGNPETLSFYSFTGLGSYEQFYFARWDNGLLARTEPIPGLTFSQGEDWMMDFSAVGNEFSMKAWKVGEPEPMAPQLVVTDNTYSSGVVGLSASISTNNIAEPTAVDATFDDVFFTEVQPTIKVVSPAQYADLEGAERNKITRALRYQQVFPASDFDILDGPHLITQIALRPDAEGAPPEATTDDLEVRLSVTSRGPENLSTVFEQNVESDAVVVWDGPFTGTTNNVGPSGGPKDFDMLIPLQTPFEYDPRDGNLLMEVVWSGWDVAPGNDGFDTPVVSIVGNPNAVSGTRFGGAVFQFTLVPLAQMQAGDADRDRDFDQLDLVRVQVAAKYLTGQPASWGEGDWNGAPGGSRDNPPVGNGLFDQLDIIAALQGGKYLTGPYAALAPGGSQGDGQTSIGYDAATGAVSVDAPAGVELTSINIDSAAGIFTGATAQNLGGSFDNDSDTNIFKATFGSSFGSLSFGNVAQAGLSQEFVLSDLNVVGSLAGGGDLGTVDLIYVPEPTALMLACLGLFSVCGTRCMGQCSRHAPRL
jgi:hypothetical protein